MAVGTLFTYTVTAGPAGISRQALRLDLADLLRRFACYRDFTDKRMNRAGVRNLHAFGEAPELEIQKCRTSIHNADFVTGGLWGDLVASDLDGPHRIVPCRGTGICWLLRHTHNPADCELLESYEAANKTPTARVTGPSSALPVLLHVSTTIPQARPLHRSPGCGNSWRYIAQHPSWTRDDQILGLYFSDELCCKLASTAEPRRARLLHHAHLSLARCLSLVQ